MNLESILPLSAARHAPAAAPTPRPRRRRRALIVAVLAGGALAVVPATGHAATTAFGSSLSVPATLDTAHNLNYGPPTAPSHDGADTALWNATQASGTPTSPGDGQILSIKLEGCVQPASGGPAPITDFHFQDLVPQGGGAVKVNVTTQTFQIPVCGSGGAGASTVTTYAPTNFCVKQGDYVDFNDEGGFNNQYYPNGAPYQVIGSVAGSTMDSFILNGGTNNGATLSPSTKGGSNGFAANSGEELMLQATLGSGPDATPLCPGGTAGTQPNPPAPGPAPGPAAPARAPLTLRAQTDGISHTGVVKLALFCAQSSACTGTVAVLSGSTRLGSAALNVPGKKTSHVAVRLTAKAVKLVRKHHRRLKVTMLVTLTSGQTFSRPITIKI
jgi:hypothetical protein